MMNTKLAVLPFDLPDWFETLERGKTRGQKRKIREIWRKHVPHRKSYDIKMNVFGLQLRKAGIEIPEHGVPKRLQPHEKSEEGESFGLNEAGIPDTPFVRNLLDRTPGASDRDKIADLWIKITKAMPRKNYAAAVAKFKVVAWQEGLIDEPPPRSQRVNKPKRIPGHSLVKGTEVLILNTKNEKYNGTTATVVKRLDGGKILLDVGHNKKVQVDPKRLFVPTTKTASRLLRIAEKL